MLDCERIKNMILKVASLKTNLPSKHMSEYLPLSTEMLETRVFQVFNKFPLTYSLKRVNTRKSVTKSKT